MESGTRARQVPLPAVVGVALLFCDLKDFTRYAESEGDEAAVAAIERFSRAVTQELGENGRLVKWLGDGAMMAYDDPVEAVATGARVVAAMRFTGLPGVHASVHHGVAIAREGDYFGSAVNLAARLLTLGGKDELVATEPVVEASAGVFDWESIGRRFIRGLAVPLPVYRLVQTATP